ncbi:MAG: hypothetical protein AAFO03_18500 [Bacteroidota bacterium]
MNSLFKWLLGRQEEDPEERPTSYLDNELCTCDRFGKVLEQYIDKLLPAEQAIAQHLIAALLELGKGSHPPQDLKLFMKMTHWCRHLQYHRHLITEWWQLLKGCAQLHNQHQALSADDCCPINRQNLPAAQAITWLYIHIKKGESVTSLLPFMDDCLRQYPLCSEIAEQLALSAANALTRQPFYRFHRHNIAIQYPNLSRGRMGRQLQIQAVRWAS